jgi:hypothetical protein
MSTVDALPLMIRSQRPLDGAETLFETWSRRGLEERRVADRRVAPQDLEADGLEQFDALATSVAEAFGARAPKLHGRVISLAEGLDPFRRLFDAARGRPRVVGLFGPT